MQKEENLKKLKKKKRGDKMKSNKGITLIALVITIIFSYDEFIKSSFFDFIEKLKLERNKKKWKIKN